ncbi:unnamed protein product [Adineta ricciae]|uniref:Uncharacterized protein n=1 Tax=Adineta ricciae TaxID=249248 RepID=A0A816DMU8_ADIRI|nr:unnamed protein product [Adineta ricciae]
MSTIEQEEEEQQQQQQNDSFFRRLINLFIEYNLFKTESIDRQTIYSQRWSTRVYIFFFLISMSILLIYNILHQTTQLIEVQSPSFGSYLQLEKMYNDIKCPCSQISVAYGSFVKLNPIFHEICFSDFISQSWIELLVDNTTATRYVGDFRSSASLQFQVLKELCDRSKNVFINNIQSFYERKFISSSLSREKLLIIYIESIISTFKDNTATAFQQPILLIRAFMIGNIMASGIETTGIIANYPQNGVPGLTYAATNYRTIGSCTCDNSDVCSVPAGFYGDTLIDTRAVIYYIEGTTNVSFLMKNWFVGCWALGSLLLSSLENSFLSNQTALNLIAKYSKWSSNLTLPTILNLNTSKQMNGSSQTFNTLLENLFLEDLLTKIDYSLYFAQCQPRSCFYSIQQSSSILYIFTSLLALYGGLSVALRFITPYFVTFLIKRFSRKINTTSDHAETELSCWRYLRIFHNHIWHLLVKFNLFPSSTRQELSDIKEQRWTTRIYILCLIIGSMILTIYTLLIVQSKTIQINNPTYETVLYLKSQNEFNSSLQCPCTKINIPYEEFIDLQPFYHQICSSELMSISFRDNLRALIQIYAIGSFRAKPDFRYTYQLFFFMNKLCTLTNKTIFQSLETFKQTQLVTNNLLSMNIFNYQINSIIKQFQSQLANRFLGFFQLFRNITYVNQIFSYLNNAQYTLIGSPLTSVTFSIGGYTDINSSYTCSCANDINCKTNTGLYNPVYFTTPKYLVPGWYKACFPIESLLHSTFECFYDNQDCFTYIINFYNQTWYQPTARLNSSLSSRFTTNTSVNILLSELFIEQWIEIINYSSYFNQCQPQACSYTVLRRKNLLEAITTIIGLIGGLAISISILISFLFINRRLCQLHTANNESISNRINQWLSKLNLFDKSTRINLKEQQQQATYIYIIILLISLSVLILYNSLIRSTKSFTIKNPSFEQYENLIEEYSIDSINCPCTQLSTSYSSFIEYQCSFHPICTSQFISPIYLQELFLIYNSLDRQYAPKHAYTLQGTIFSHFQALLSLCNLAQDAVNDAWNTYFSSSLISDSLIHYNLFDKQINASLGQFKSTLSNNYLNNLQLIRGITQSNAFVSLYSTNWYPIVNNSNPLSTIYMKPQYYNNCNCLTSSTCTQSSIPFLKGYLVGCTPLEALLQSSIACLYDQSCINFLFSYLNLTLPILQPLNLNETHFSLNNTIDSIVQEMFIEKCSSNVSYYQFFTQCQPLSCTVTVIKRNNALFVITALLGLYGGLTTFLKLIIPIFIALLYKLIRKWKRKGIVRIFAE